MATVITTPQVGNSYCPQMKLTATVSSQTETTATIRVVVEYVTYGYTFTSSSSPEVSEKINGTWYDETGWAVGGKTSQKVRDRSVTVSKGTSAKSVEVKLYWGMSGFKWAGSSMSDWNLAGSISVPAKTSYKVSYDANGGSGAPSAQTKWHGTALALSETVPTRADHEFVCWNTKADGSGTSYAPGASYTANATATLYAVWAESYVPPTIGGLSAVRCDSGGNADDDGGYARVSFAWAVDTSIYPDNAVASIEVACSVRGADSWTSTAVSASGASGEVSQVVGTFGTDASYDVRVTVADSHGSSSMFAVLSQAFFTMDVLAGGHGVALGMAATEADTYANAYRNVHFVGETASYSETMDAFIAALSGGGAADYVIEQGDGYRKWSSGRMECWVSQAVTTTVNTAWGNLYRSAYTTGPDWPQAFASIAQSWSTAYASGGDMAFFGASGGQSTTKATNGYLLRGQALTTAKAFQINHYAIGTWK